MKKRIFRLLLLTLCAACLLSSLGTAAMAAGRIDFNEGTSLTINFVINRTGIPGVTASVYRVADINEWGEFTLCGDFRGYSGEINGWRTAGEWDAVAGNLASYVSQKRLVALCSARTGEDGSITFIDKMDHGLYLVMFNQIEYKGMKYTAKSFLVSLPDYDEYEDEWVYDVSVNAKAGPVPTPPPSPPPYLPQTGQLWWPVPALLCGGLFLLLVGVVKRRSRNDEET